jgi:hypothetical protein
MDLQTMAATVAATIWLVVEIAKRAYPDVDKKRLSLALASIISVGLMLSGQIPPTEGALGGFMALVASKMFHDAVQNPVLDKKTKDTS